MWSIRSLVVGLINIAMSVVAFFIGLRFIFNLFAANTATPVVSWVHQISGNLIYPFSGMFPNLTLQGGSFIDVVALVALVVYSILGYLAIALVDSVAVPASTEVHSHSDRVHAH